MPATTHAALADKGASYSRSTCRPRSVRARRGAGDVRRGRHHADPDRVDAVAVAAGPESRCVRRCWASARPCGSSAGTDRTTSRSSPRSSRSTSSAHLRVLTMPRRRSPGPSRSSTAPAGSSSTPRASPRSTARSGRRPPPRRRVQSASRCRPRATWRSTASRSAPSPRHHRGADAGDDLGRVPCRPRRRGAVHGGWVTRGVRRAGTAPHRARLHRRRDGPDGRRPADGAPLTR